MNVEIDGVTVEMYTGRYIEGDATLRTCSVGGCYVTLIYTERGGRKQGILTHYPPRDRDMNANVTKLR